MIRALLVFGSGQFAGRRVTRILTHQKFNGHQIGTLNSQRKFSRDILIGTTLLLAGFAAPPLFAQPANPGQATNEIRIVALQGTVEISPKGATTWVLTQTNQVLYPFDRLRTGPNSRVALHWADESIVPFGASTELEVLPPHEKDAEAGLHLVRGVLSFFHRDKPGRIRVITRGAVAGIEGTEFVLAVDDSDRTTLSVIDGKVRFGNEQATLMLTNGEQAVAETGKAPARTAGFIANNVLQWCFYYPAVLDPDDLQLDSDGQSTLAESLQAYRAGDLLAALAKYPSGRQPASDAERVYYAALLLSVGEVEKAEGALNSISAGDVSGRPQRLATALRQMIAAVKRQTISAPTPQLATEFLADSYYEQSRAERNVSLTQARLSARQAAAKSPQFGFAWARVAELEFSFGRTAAAADALEKSLALAPRNAQALALKGFLLAAQNKTREAIEWFDRALALDSALGNAWLGRGLCRIHRGDDWGGREDLLVAAALEPQRAELRSYLGKAFGDSGDFSRAMKELHLAMKLDPQDPTAWLYSALINQENNRINEGIRDLEKSQQLNDNRSVYRSQLLLDQDQAVRSANLAAMYDDAGMTDWATHEAARAVNYDYANYSAHLFLANSFAALRDPNEVNLRYETPAFSEFLVANLLAPVSAGVLSPTVSAQEYSPLFNRTGPGLVSDTEYLSRGAWTESGAQYGVFDNFNYSLEAFYRSDPGQRINNDIEQRQISLSTKAQLTPQDSAYFLMQFYNATGGDLAEYFNQANASSSYRFDERQEPIIGIGYHHDWSPGVHTLVFGARLVDNASFTNLSQPSLIAFHIPTASPPPLSGVNPITAAEHYDGKPEIYSGEVQQIFEQTAHTTILGGRAQYGDFQTMNLQGETSAPGFFTGGDAAQQNITSLFRRFSLYGYHQWEVTDWLELIGGVAYDRITFPANFRSAPISSAETTEDQVSPKAGMIWRPATNTTVRFAYTRSLGGASFDQSFQLEPSQVAGFVQSFRSIIPESVVGDNAGAKFETYGLSLEQKFSTGTYVGVTGQLLNSHVHRLDGAFDYTFTVTPVPVPSSLIENLDYREPSLLFTANQLLGRDWAVGARYQLSQAVLHDDYPGVPTNPAFDFLPHQRLEATLNQLSLFLIFNHPSGFFAEGETVWYSQDNDGYRGGEPGDDFWQVNAFAGYRFPRRRAEVSLGLLNLTDRDYQLNPLNIYNELPRRRTLAAEFKLNF